MESLWEHPEASSTKIPWVNTGAVVAVNNVSLLLLLSVFPKSSSQEITPARISVEEAQKVQELSKRIYNLLQLGSIARIDFMMVNKQPYVIEVNTTPGFSEQSIIPKMLKVNKQSILDFWQEIISVELEGA